MRFFNLFKTKKASSTPLLDFEVVSWSKHEDDISALFDEMTKNDAFSKEYSTTIIPCYIKPEPTNKHDKNAMLILAKCPKSNTKWHNIGYVPSELCDSVKTALNYVKTGNFYWCCKMSYSKVSGTKFYIELKPSNYAK